MSCSPVELDGFQFNSLSWADDLILISTSESGLQNSLNALNSYCHKWSITINPSKTMCMIMSKGKCKKYPDVLLNNQKLTFTNRVTYLGFIITPNMNHTGMIEDRILKANRAAYLLRQALSSNGSILDVNLAMSLFDKIISPILLYGCSIWGLPKTTNLLYLKGLAESHDTRPLAISTLEKSLNRPVEIKSAKLVGKKESGKARLVLVEMKRTKDKIDVLYENRNDTHVSILNYDYKHEDNLYERMHSSFLKHILLVNKFSSNSAVRGELGRFPLNIKVYSLCVKYWHNARINSPNCILRSAMFSSQIHNSPWLESIEFILKINGMGNVWENLCSVSTLYLYKVIKQRLSDQYMQNWFTNNPFKRNGLERIKSKYERSTYFKYIESPNIRSIVTKLRIGNSILRSSVHLNTECESSFCPMCSRNVETLKHFIMECPANNNILLLMT